MENFLIVYGGLYVMYHLWSNLTFVHIKTNGLAILVPYAISPVMILVFKMSLRTMHQYRIVWATYLPPKNGKLCMKVCQVDGTEWLHILWPMKYNTKAGANLYSLTCKLLKGGKKRRGDKSNILVQSYKGCLRLKY